MTREDLEALTKDELREHAKVQGVELGSLDTKGTMVDKLLGEHVQVAQPKKAHVEEKLPALGKLRNLDGTLVVAPKYRVTIYDTESDHSDVDIICNGHNIRVQRGKEVILLEPYVEILRNAVVESIAQDPDTGVRSATKRMIYPHQAILIG